MHETARALEAARTELGRALRRSHPAGGDAESTAYDLVDELVGAFLLAHVGAIGEVAVEDLLSGAKTLEALRATARTWWAWRVGPGLALEAPAPLLKALALAVDAWVRAFDGTPADVLLACHELRLSGDRESRRKNGAFYTPSSAAGALVEEALATVTRRPGKPPRILDPACGTGAFLVAAFRQLVAAQIDQPMEGSFARRLALAAATLHGVDRDARHSSRCSTTRACTKSSNSRSRSPRPRRSRAPSAGSCTATRSWRSKALSRCVPAALRPSIGRASSLRRSRRAASIS
jgi:hypothetical protein